MIFGKTTQEAYAASQKRLQSLYGKRHRKLALWPVKLTDGRIAWLRWIYVVLPITLGGSGSYYHEWWNGKKYYAECINK